MAGGCRVEWVEWNCSVSRVVSVGSGVEKSNLNLVNQDLFIIIPGNPGLSGFYEPFMLSLQERIGSPDLSIWCISHAGHDTQTSAPLPLERTFSLNEQILHKLELLDRLVPHSTRLTLLGHSIGCKIIMEIYRRNTTHTLEGSYFLFPTIENMKSTVEGRAVYPLTTTYRIPIVLLITLIYNLVPGCILRYLIRAKLMGVPQKITDTVKTLANPNFVNNCLVMARAELEEVVLLDEETLSSMAGRLRVYYGSRDGWCPLSFRDNLLQVDGITENAVVVDDTGMEHAFVLRAGEKLGKIIGDWTKEKF